MTKQKNTQTIAQLLDSLASEMVVRQELAQRLSNPSEEDYRGFCDNFHFVSTETRQKLLNRLADMMELDYQLDFGKIADFALDDEDYLVRVEAISCLWFETTPYSMRRLIALLEEDPHIEVRAAAASSLGRYILSAELDEFPAEQIAILEETLISIWISYEEDPELRRRALESISYSSRDEIPSFIEEAFSDYLREVRISAILAMGRNGNEKLWGKTIVDSLVEENAEVRFEAVHAAGEMMLEEAVPYLIQLINDDDKEIQIETIWALGEIGGDQAKSSLLSLQAELDDEDMLDLVDEALSMALLINGEIDEFYFESEEIGDSSAVDGFFDDESQDADD